MAKTQEATSNVPAVQSDYQFHALQPSGTVRKALEANLAPGETMSVSDLVRVTIPSGGGTTFTIDTVRGEEDVKSITGLFVYYGMRGLLWPSQETGEGMRPLLVTNDLRVAYKVGEDYGDLSPEAIESCRNEDGTYDWQKLVYNKWGTDKNGRGKRCKESRILGILQQNEAFPVIISAPPGSLAAIKTFVHRLPVAHYQAIVELSLERENNKGGQPFSKLSPKMVGTVSDDEAEAARVMYTQPLSDVLTRIETNFNDLEAMD